MNSTTKFLSITLLFMMVVTGMANAGTTNSSTTKATAKIDYAKKKRQINRRKVGLTSKMTSKKLAKAHRYADKKQFNKAVRILVKLLKKTKERKYEFAQVWQNLGFILIQKNDLDKAAKAFKNSIKLYRLPMNATLTSLYSLGQLYMGQEKYPEAIETMTEWFAYADKPAAESYVLLGTAYYYTGKKKEALKYVNTALTSTDKPKEKWLQFALALNHELEQYGNALKILATLTSTYPKNPKYWKQLSATYLSLEKDSKALATMELAHKLGHVKDEADIVSMANLYLYLELPHKGAKLMEKEMLAGNVKSTEKNLAILSQSWLMARDRTKALANLELAAKKADHGDHFAKKAFLHMEREEWTDVISSARAGIKKGKVKKADKLLFALGIAQYNKKQYSAAIKTFIKAKKAANKDQHKQIDTWINQAKEDQLAMK